MANPKYQARLRDPLASKVNEWQEATGITKDADAVRELMRYAVENWDAGDDDSDPGTASYLAESVALIFAMGAAVLAPLSVPLPALWPFAVAYLVVAALAFGYILWRCGVCLPRVPRPWRRSG